MRSSVSVVYSLQLDAHISDIAAEQDENEAINRSNILGGDRLRHAKPRGQGKYNEGPDEEDLPREAQ